MTHSIGSADVELWVKKVAELSQQPVDWHFCGGRARILALGDTQRVRTAMLELRKEHDDLFYRQYKDVYSPEVDVRAQFRSPLDALLNSVVHDNGA